MSIKNKRIFKELLNAISLAIGLFFATLMVGQVFVGLANDLHLSYEDQKMLGLMPWVMGPVFGTFVGIGWFFIRMSETTEKS